MLCFEQCSLMLMAFWANFHAYLTVLFYVTEALDSKSAKAITKENDRLLDKIEKMLQTGQV